jgi:hypothetical protein
MKPLLYSNKQKSGLMLARFFNQFTIPRAACLASAADCESACR